MARSRTRHPLKTRRPDRVAWWFVFAWFACGLAFALDPGKAFEHYVSNTWSIQEGLPQISALSIAQDRTGYVWVGTQNGLARFDGVRFTTYTPDNESALPGVFVRALLSGKDGRLWIGTYKGLAVLDHGRFRTVPTADAKRFPSIDVAALAQLADGSVVAASNVGVFRVVDEHLEEVAGGPRPALSILPMGDGMWVGGNGTVVRFDHGRAEAMPLPPQAATAGVSRLAQAQGHVWAGTTQGLYSRAGDAWARYDEDAALATSPISSILRDHDDNLWISTNSGFLRLRDGHVTERVEGMRHRAARSVMSSFEDREGNLWLGSQLEGLARLWNGWTRRYSADDGLNDPIVWALARGPDGVLWVGGNDGLSTFDGKRFTLVVPGSALPHPQAYSLLAEPDRIWIGTRRGLAIWRNGRIETPALYAPMASAQIHGIVHRPDGDVWFPTTEGFFVEHAGALRRYGEADGLGDARIRTVFETRAHRVLVGTQGGLFEKRGDRFTAVPGLPHGIDVTTIVELPSGTLVVGVITESVYVSDGAAWKNIGLAQGLPSDAPFFTTVDDRGFLWIAGIRGVERVSIIDLDRFAKGSIARVRGELLLNERGDRNSGQQGFCCNGAGLSKGFIENHVLWLPTRDGVVALDTHGIVKNKVTPQVTIEGVRYLDAWHAVDASADHVELAPAARDLAFDFTAPSFQDPHSILMRYRLIGYDRDWHDLEDVTRRRVNYTNLPPGDYTFAVMAANNAGVWAPDVARFSFGIRPWFHETKGFYAMLAMLLGLLVYAGYVRQRRLHAAQRLVLEEQVRERTHDLTATLDQLRNAQDELVRKEKLASLGGLVAGIAHEINTPLGICVTATSYVQSELRQWRALQEAGRLDANRIDEIFESLEHSMRLLDSNTRRGAELVRSFKQVAVDQSSGQRREFDLARTLDESVLALKPKLTRACNVEVDCPSGIAMTSYPGALSQVLWNLLMNAALHAFEGRERGTIRIEGRADGAFATLLVADDGIGMQVADVKRYFDPFFTTRRGKGATGLGAHIVFNLVTGVLGGTIQVSSTPGTGTQVHMRLPCVTRAGQGG